MTIKLMMCQLTKRQLEILPLIRTGRRYKELAYELGITEQSLKAHAKQIRQKLRLEGQGKSTMLKETE